MTHLLYILMNYLNNSLKKDTNYYIALSLAQGISLFPNWTLEQTAEYCNVSVSTLNRFFRDIGFENFSRVKEIITHEEERKNILLDSTSINNITNVIHKTLENIKMIDLSVFAAVADYIKKSNKIIFFAYGNNINFTLKAQVELMVNGKFSLANIDTLRQLKTIEQATQGDLVICISRNGSSLQDNMLKNHIEKKGLHSILITQSKDCEPFDYFDIILNIGPNQGYDSFKYGIIYVLDLICSEYKAREYFYK